MALTGRESTAFLELTNVSRFYGDFAALEGVSLSLEPGEVHVLLGENGAGKSTLVSLLTGVSQPDLGTRWLCGQRLDRMSPAQARQGGINAVLQDFSLSPNMTVEENYVLGREHRRFLILDKRRMRAEATAALNQLGLAVDPKARVDTLSKAEQQMLEIVRALGGRPGALILDEPTASLSHDESNRLFEVIRQLRNEGWALLYISHRMEEVRRLGDVVTILRDGHVVGHHRLGDISDADMIAEMVGRELDDIYPTITTQRGDRVLEAQELCVGQAVRGVSINLHAGEIVGLGGLVGCGKTELARSLFGLEVISGGMFTLAGEPISHPNPNQMLRRGLIYLPQDRRGEALALNRSIEDNVILEMVGDRASTHGGLLRQRFLTEQVHQLLAKLKISPANPQQDVSELSGGNQQKVVLARALSKSRAIYVFDEPTAGIDVGARLDFYQQLINLCEQGAAILLVTSDLQELVNLSHRAYVMREGHLVAELAGDELRDEVVMSHAFDAHIEAGAA